VAQLSSVRGFSAGRFASYGLIFNSRGSHPQPRTTATIAIATSRLPFTPHAGLTHQTITMDMLWVDWHEATGLT
jgi:hypothetical protein